MKQRRNSKQRELILDAVRKHRDHPSADEIFVEARIGNSSISRGTVYRNLHLLAEAGQIRLVKIPGAERYDYQVSPHYHLLCVGCGKLIDVAIAYRAELDQTLAAQVDYEILQHRTLFEGVCPDCRVSETGEE